MEKVTIKYNNDDVEDEIDIYVHTTEEDYVSKIIKWNKIFFEVEMLTFLKKNFNNQKNILDIGANIGNHSLFFAKYINCDKIYSFEPVQKNIELFNVNLSNYKDKCFLFKNALSYKNGKMKLYNNGENNYGGFSLNKENDSYEVDIIDVFKLDKFNFDNISLIKIDVENHEIEVLIGAKETILKNKPTIILENSYYYFSHIFPDPEPHKEILEEFGYKKIHSNIYKSAMDIWVPI